MSVSHARTLVRSGAILHECTSTRTHKASLENSAAWSRRVYPRDSERVDTSRLARSLTSESTMSSCATSCGGHVVLSSVYEYSTHSETTLSRRSCVSTRAASSAPASSFQLQHPRHLGSSFSSARVASRRRERVASFQERRLFHAAAAAAAGGGTRVHCAPNVLLHSTPLPFRICSVTHARAHQSRSGPVRVHIRVHLQCVVKPSAARTSRSRSLYAILCILLTHLQSSLSHWLTIAHCLPLPSLLHSYLNPSDSNFILPVRLPSCAK